MPHDISPSAIEQTYELIRPYLRVTPVLALDPAVTLKLELLQHAGSFKTRGAFTHLLRRTVPATGVIAASGGNHGAAVAYAASRVGVRAEIFVPSVSSPAKVARIRGYGAELVIAGDRYADALAASEVRAAETGALTVHAYDDPETLLGQGTVALELLNQAPIDTILVAVGGGGLIGGMAAYVSGRARVIGVEPVTAPTLTRALEAGHPVDAPAGGIAADSLAPARVGSLMFPIAVQYVERVVLVEDAAIERARQTMWEKARVLAEPGGAAAYAALDSGAYRPQSGERIAVIVSGGNTTATF
jgi:threonine dehydratase